MKNYSTYLNNRMKMIGMPENIIDMASNEQKERLIYHGEMAAELIKNLISILDQGYFNSINLSLMHCQTERSVLIKDGEVDILAVASLQDSQLTNVHGLIKDVHDSLCEKKQHNLERVAQIARIKQYIHTNIEEHKEKAYRYNVLTCLYNNDKIDIRTLNGEDFVNLTSIRNSLQDDFLSMLRTGRGDFKQLTISWGVLSKRSPSRHSPIPIFPTSQQAFFAITNQRDKILDELSNLKMAREADMPFQERVVKIIRENTHLHFGRLIDWIDLVDFIHNIPGYKRDAFIEELKEADGDLSQWIDRYLAKENRMQQNKSEQEFSDNEFDFDDCIGYDPRPGSH